MTSAWPRGLLLLLLLLLLTVAAALPNTIDIQALQCRSAEQVTKSRPSFFPLDEQGATSIRFSFAKENAWDAEFTLGEGAAGGFTPRVHLEIRKTKPKAQLAIVKLRTEEGKNTLLLNSRVDSTWLEGDGQAALFLGEDAVSIAFLNGDSKFLQQVSDPQLAGLSVVKVEGGLQVEECEGPVHVPDTTTAVPATTTTTTAVPTTTPTTTTTTTTTTTETATTLPTTTKPATTTSFAGSLTTTPTEGFSTPFTTEDTHNNTTSEDDLPLPCLPTDNAGADYEVATVCPTPSNDTVVAVEGSVQCVGVPRWAWACAGLAVVFFVFIVALVIYAITLYKRSWRHEKALQASGGFALTAGDMHYYEMRNNNLMIGNTIPRIVTPRPSSLPGLTPSHSSHHISHSLSPSRSTTPFPIPLQTTDLKDSMINVTDQKDKSRCSKVSFADE